ncbi:MULTISPECIES: poly-beta-1,6-N-acetyl-D-glucosamine biosynthesis protein PgaD [unclassified Acinetobacter]|uniref:poly-beta-1,6-N-acetyl-D-glucosamine biosynthesis protein PgaD n=1 Tax=unclassified Acinetobacter TaxID=196816 RepID=UPI00293468D4|nr:MULTISPECIES: poly-beta-1,6-N-acetyl-D-glucosamine biosynthesis protein PgaD [unclassified Acinetobacter]WOE30519.1 poly-beta-1,6-N-acetyl-D-glucosamine biosynthesis protein PgaD [Acinetobacter sp. SAAs470]WOE38710.1 poly-beta-1,6-N-acetyl-D-glucosamine biosynthesis protein PgaD [Acinetobacter sp. SAAs474]
MKNSGLIIDLRRQLPWHQRYASGTSTALMWAVWLLLWRPVIIVTGLIALQKHHVIQHIFDGLSIGIGHGLTALVACSIALLFWSNFMPAITITKTSAKCVSDYSNHFHLPIALIEHGRQQKISVIHYDEHGKITQIEPSEHV